MDIVLAYGKSKAPTNIFITTNGPRRTIGTYEVVGLYIPDSDRELGIYCSENFYNREIANRNSKDEVNDIKDHDAVYDYALLPLDRPGKNLKTIAPMLGVENPDTGVRYDLKNVLYTKIVTVNEIADKLSDVFLGVGIAMATFASLLLFNFISMSISVKKKEIGILRAVGAKQ